MTNHNITKYFSYYKMGAYTYRCSLALMSGKTVAAGFLISFSGYGFGALLAWMCR